MINNEFKCIFVHIPKTGGTSIIHALKLDNKGHPTLSKQTPNTFTIIRNPFDRVVSLFCYIKTENTFYHKKNPYYEYFANCDFEAFIKRLNHGRTYHLTRPQSDYIYDDKNNLLVDHVLRYETLQKDFNKFWDIKLPHLNKSDRHKDWRKYYNKNTIKPVYEFYKRDFKNFNYDTRTKRLG